MTINRVGMQGLMEGWLHAVHADGGQQQRHNGKTMKQRMHLEISDISILSSYYDSNDIHTSSKSGSGEADAFSTIQDKYLA